MQIANPARLVVLVGALAAVVGAMLALRALAAGGEAETAAPSVAAAKQLTRTPAAKRTANRAPVAANGLPRAVAAALARHRVVVVSVVSPGATLDELAAGEARAGAALARAGFVQLNARRNSEIAPFVEKVGLRRNPAVVVMRRPADVAVQLPGFADRDSVAQAASDARS